MDDLIPFLIVILITIIGSVAQIKKKRALQQNSAQKPQPNRTDDLFGWLEKLNDPEFDQPSPYTQNFRSSQNDIPIEIEDEDVETAPLVEKIDNKYVKYTGFISPEEKQKLVASEGNSALEKTEAKNNITKSPGKKRHRLNQKLNEEFCLRKAVIYSEILNRKYQ